MVLGAFAAVVIAAIWYSWYASRCEHWYGIRFGETRYAECIICGHRRPIKDLYNDPRYTTLTPEE